MMIRRPQKAPTDPITDGELTQLTYPLVGSPKLDGFRCTVNGEPLTSSMKQFGNLFVRRELSNPIFNGLDGEVIVGAPTDPRVFEHTSGPLRRYGGEPDFKFYVFDKFTDKNLPYSQRWLSVTKPTHPRLIVLEQRPLYSTQDVIAYDREMLSLGYEGAMIRSLTSSYKEGRATFREQNIFKRKPFVEIDAVIVGFKEALQNMNVASMSELGLMKRSHCRENMLPKDTLGSLVLKASLWEKPFNARLGEGFTAESNKEMWESKEWWLGQVVVVKYQKYGSRDAPRLPSVIKLRPEWDVSTQ